MKDESPMEPLTYIGPDPTGAIAQALYENDGEAEAKPSWVEYEKANGLLNPWREKGRIAWEAVAEMGETRWAAQWGEGPIQLFPSAINMASFADRYRGNILVRTTLPWMKAPELTQDEAETLAASTWNTAVGRTSPEFP